MPSARRRHAPSARAAAPANRRRCLSVRCGAISSYRPPSTASTSTLRPYRPGLPPLRQGARANGFDTDHWTLTRVTAVIRQTTGHRYHPGHTWKLLRRMGWRLRRPSRRAIERDEQAIARWVAEDWP